MLALVAGMLVFCTGHLLPRATGLRGRLIESIGELPYKGLYSLVVSVGLGLIIWGKANADYLYLYTPAPLIQDLSYVIMPSAFILLSAAYIPNNLRRLIKNPMLTAIKLWAIVHLLMNGDLASVVLFSGFLLFAAVSVIMAKRFDLGKEHPPVAIGFDLVTVAVGIAATTGFMAIHQSIAGVSAL